MPYPAQIDRQQLVETAFQILEREGVEGVSLSRVAQELGVKSPSLYRYVRNKAALLRAVNEHFLALMFAALAQAQRAAPAGPEAAMVSIAIAMRDFAHAHPQAYAWSMTNTNDAYRSDENQLVQQVLPLQSVMAEISGATQSLTALRGLLAITHGFIMLELGAQLRRGGDLDAVFTQSVTAYLSGWTGTIAIP
jgi:AcrR family transcriptional regulator